MSVSPMKPAAAIFPVTGLTRRSVLSWLCSLSPTVVAFVMLLLAVHGWILGESETISENSGPFFFQIHLLVLTVLALFATWFAGPAWCLLCLLPGSRQPFHTCILQVIIFVAGCLLMLGAMLLVEASPARRAF